MGKSTRKVKRILALFLVVLMSIDGFSAIVSDNDGSAFVTKAEFEALKSNFSSQIDNYNDSIDKKIDGAIGGYLAGIKLAKTSTEKFPVCGDEKIVITNTKNINDIKFGKVGIDWKLHFTMILSVKYGGFWHNGSCGTVTLTRTGNDNYEAFIIDNSTEKFKYYGNALRINTKVNFAQVKAVQNGAAAFDSVEALANLKLRWGADPYGKADRGEQETPPEGDGTPQWSHYFGNNTFFAVYATGLNWGNLYVGGNIVNRFVYQNNATTVEIKNDKIKWLIDDSDIDTTVWVKDPEKNPKSLTDLVATNSVTTGREYTLPSDAGIAGYVDITSCNYDLTDGATHGYDNRRNPISGSYNLIWCDYGSYNNASSPTSGQSTPWKEFHLVTNEKKPSSLVNENFSTDILSTYASYGFHGYVTEGIPIGIFKADTSVEFDIDTTGLGTLNFGVKNVPFNTDNMASMVADTSIELTVDGVNQSRPVKAISAGKHKIRIKNIDAQPLFIKLAMPRGSNPKNRRILTWPGEYTLIDES